MDSPIYKLLCCGSPHRRDHLPSLYRAHPLCSCCLVPAWHRMLMMLETVIESLLTLGGTNTWRLWNVVNILESCWVNPAKNRSEFRFFLFLTCTCPYLFVPTQPKKCFLKHNNNKKKRLEIKNQPPWIEFHMRWPFHKAVGFYGLHTRRWLERMEARSDCY